MIYHVTSNFSRPGGNPGPTEVIRQLTKYLTDRGRHTTVLAADKAETAVTRGVDLVEFPLQPWGRIWRYPQGFSNYLEKITRGSQSLLHIHEIWLAPQWLAARIARRNRVPAILTSHGEYSTWHWRDGSLRRIKKLAYWFTLASPAFRHLSVFHAITPEERDDLHRHFPQGRFEVIPNAIDLEEADLLLAQAELESPPPLDKPYLLFVGRLHPKKGVKVLIQAFAQSIRGRDFRLAIVGPGDSAYPSYPAELTSLVHSLGLETRVSFLGAVYGPRKWRLYRDAWAFCAPSHSEVVGLVNLEAAAAATPGVTTHETGLFDWEEGGGILVHAKVAEVAEALDRVFAWRESERDDRGRSLRQLVERRYSWETIGPRWLSLYDDLLEKYR